MSGYQKASASTHNGECKPLDHLPVQRSRTVHDFVFGEATFLLLSLPNWFQKSQDSWPIVPPSLHIQQPGAEVAGPSLSGKAQEAAPAAHSELSCWRRSHNCSQAFKGAP